MNPDRIAYIFYKNGELYQMTNRESLSMRDKDLIKNGYVPSYAYAPELPILEPSYSGYVFFYIDEIRKDWLHIENISEEEAPAEFKALLSLII